QAASETSPRLSQARTMQHEHVAHIYYNMATGERIATLIADGIRPADTGTSTEIWISDNGLPCGDFGQTSGTSALIDIVDSLCFITYFCFDSVFLDWGDVVPDTVIDCVGISWSTQHADTDTNSDGIGDGVPGFGARWTWYDADDGFDSGATRVALTGFSLINLPGVPGVVDPDLLSTYTATVDLAGSFSSSLAFEVGDTDSESSVSIFNPGAGTDLDGDGLSDFSFSLKFIQPGRRDIDNADGDDNPWTGIDGDPDAAASAGWPIALPLGTTTLNSDGTYSFTPDAFPAAQGIEDAFDLFLDQDSDGMLEPTGTFYLGGFTCDTDGDGVPGDVTPYAQFAMNLFGPGPDVVDCPPDLDGNGLLNFFDVQAFITAFNTNDLAIADLVAPFGTLNIHDILVYISLYSSGCP
ncbi:MAG: GC-type dockerin domain-anchored protein, partial [Phycisphaerales bacterium]